MSEPARAGIFIYGKYPERLADFYQAVLGMTVAHRTEQMIVLRSPDAELIVHAIPAQIASQITITNPPQLRENTAIKFYCTVASFAAATDAAQALGGQVFSEQWAGPGFVVRNASDPEGNIFQVRVGAD